MACHRCSVRRLAAVLEKRRQAADEQKGQQAAPQCKAGASSRTPKWQATALQRSKLLHFKKAQIQYGMTLPLQGRIVRLAIEKCGNKWLAATSVLQSDRTRMPARPPMATRSSLSGSAKRQEWSRSPYIYPTRHENGSISPDNEHGGSPIPSKEINTDEGQETAASDRSHVHPVHRAFRACPERRRRRGSRRWRQFQLEHIEPIFAIQ